MWFMEEPSLFCVGQTITKPNLFHHGLTGPGWMAVWESYSHPLEKGGLFETGNEQTCIHSIPCCVWTPDPSASSLSSLQFFPVTMTAPAAAVSALALPLAFDISSSAAAEWPSLAVAADEWRAPCADLLWRMRRGRKLTWITGKFTEMLLRLLWKASFMDQKFRDPSFK